jgi:hypothetical protein
MGDPRTAEYEMESSEALIYIAMSQLTLRRMAPASAVTFHSCCMTFKTAFQA